MATLKLSSDKKYPRYFQLKYEFTGVQDGMKHYLVRFGHWLRNIPSYLIGRAVSLVIFNPLIAVNSEKERYGLTQHAKFPDQQHTSDRFIFNVTPKDGFISKIINNYARELHNRTNWFIPNWLKNLLRQHVLKINTLNETHIKNMLTNIKEILFDGSAKPNEIILKGLEHLTESKKVHLLKQVDTICKEYDKDFKSYATANNDIQFFTLETQHGAVLDSVEIIPKTQQMLAPDKRRYVIVCMPRSNNYTAWLKSYRISSTESDAVYVAFNYRGVERSLGVLFSEENMIEDALSQYERLIAMGIPPANIGFEGECLGGAVATIAASRMAEQGHDVKLMNVRSFQSVTKLILYRILPGENQTSLFGLRYLGAALFMLTIAPILWLSNCNLNAADAYKKIPEKNKDFVVVRSKLDETSGERKRDDAMVNHQNASIYAMLNARRKLLKLKGSDRTEQEETEFNSLPALKKHKFTPNPKSYPDGKDHRINGHTCVRQTLISRYDDIDARSYCSQFFKQAFDKSVQPKVVTCEELPGPDIL